MKKIMIIIRPGSYFKTKSLLSENRFYAMTTKEVLGRGKERVDFTAGKGEENDKVSETHEVYENTMVAKKMIEIVTADENVDEIIKLVLSVNSRGKDGDGKIFVIPIEESIRIHTGEIGEDALI